MSWAEKWNPRIKQYEPYALPDGASLVEVDMDKLIACAQCGEGLTYGSGYTSKQVHTSLGMGYSVCGDCYNKEWKEDEQYG